MTPGTTWKGISMDLASLLNTIGSNLLLIIVIILLVIVLRRTGIAAHLTDTVKGTVEKVTSNNDQANNDDDVDESDSKPTA